MGIVVDYSVIDEATAKINQIMNDVAVQKVVGELQTKFTYSQSDFVELLKDEAEKMREINQLVNDLMYDTREMLHLAKIIYEDGDAQMSNIISGKEG